MRWMRIDHALITVAVEFQYISLPTEEARVTLKDVAHIYGLPIDGPAFTEHPYSRHNLVEVCEESPN